VSSAGLGSASILLVPRLSQAGFCIATGEKPHALCRASSENHAPTELAIFRTNNIRKTLEAYLRTFQVDLIDFDGGWSVAYRRKPLFRHFDGSHDPLWTSRSRDTATSKTPDHATHNRWKVLYMLGVFGMVLRCSAVLCAARHFSKTNTPIPHTFVAKAQRMQNSATISA
jgi:hypothetical protein